MKKEKRRAGKVAPYRPRARLIFATINSEQISEFIEQKRLGRQRVGRTPEERLGWVVSFARGDLDRLRPEERVALGYDLRALVPRTWGYRVPVAPLQEQDLRSIHEEVRRGVASLLEKGEWRLRATPRIVLMREEEEEEDQAVPSYRVGLSWRGTEAQAILGGVMDLLLDVGDRLRACAQCREAFVKRKRQAYCSTACSQRARDQRKRDARER